MRDAVTVSRTPMTRIRILTPDNLVACLHPLRSRIRSPSSPAAGPASGWRSRSASASSARAIVVGSRDSKNLEAGTAALRHAGLDPLAVQIDVRKPDQVDEMVERVLRHFGRIDILVNNAAGNFICKAEELSPNGWNAVVGIVLNGSFYCSRAVGRHMIARGKGGAIVSVLANYVWTGSPGTIHSAAAKAGVMSMTQTLAVEWAPHAHPRQRRRARADRVGGRRQAALEHARRRSSASPARCRWAAGASREVADAVAFLASPGAGFITGEMLTIDGGARLGAARSGSCDRRSATAGRAQIPHGPILPNVGHCVQRNNGLIMVSVSVR